MSVCLEGSLVGCPADKTGRSSDKTGKPADKTDWPADKTDGPANKTDGSEFCRTERRAKQRTVRLVPAEAAPLITSTQRNNSISAREAVGLVTHTPCHSPLAVRFQPHGSKRGIKPSPATPVASSGVNVTRVKRTGPGDQLLAQVRQSVYWDTSQN